MEGTLPYAMSLVGFTSTKNYKNEQATFQYVTHKISFIEHYFIFKLLKLYFIILCV